MLAMRTVLCPIDFSAVTERQVELAAELCRLFGARLVLHHNFAVAATGAGVGWMWAGEHQSALSEPEVERRLTDYLDRLPAELAREACVTHGLPSQAVLRVSDAMAADLLVLATHGATGEEHTSITEQILERSERSLLVLHEPDTAQDSPDFAAPATPDAELRVVLVPTDLTAGSSAAVELAFDLARKLPLELHLLHVAEGTQAAGELDRAALALRTRVPADLTERVKVHVEQGDATLAIATLAARLGATCIVMGEHSRAPLRRWFHRDTSMAVLHRAPCPVWYVPSRAA